MPSPDEWAIVRLSLIVAFTATAASAVPGVAIGWLLARRRFPGWALLNGVVHAPLVLPPVVTGYVLLLLLGRRGLVGSFLHERLGLDIAFTRSAAVLAAAVMGFPLLVRSVRLGIELVDVRYEQAARTLGARPWRVLTSITLPLALPGILTGLVLAFARALGEFGATIMFAGNLAGETRTMPLAVYTAVQSPGGDATALRLSVLAIALSVGALIISESIARRVRR